MPLHFRPVPGSGIPYPSVIVEITPDEFDRIRLQDLKLPDGWTVDEEYSEGDSLPDTTAQIRSPTGRFNRV